MSSKTLLKRSRSSSRSLSDDEHSILSYTLRAIKNYSDDLSPSNRIRSRPPTPYRSRSRNRRSTKPPPIPSRTTTPSSASCTRSATPLPEYFSNSYHLYNSNVTPTPVRPPHLNHLLSQQHSSPSVSSPTTIASLFLTNSPVNPRPSATSLYPSIESYHIHRGSQLLTYLASTGRELTEDLEDFSLHSDLSDTYSVGYRYMHGEEWGREMEHQLRYMLEVLEKVKAVKDALEVSLGVVRQRVERGLRNLEGGSEFGNQD